MILLLELMIDGIRSQKRNGDCAYSDSALYVFISRYVDKFEPLTGEARAGIFSKGSLLESDKNLAKINVERPNDILSFSKKVKNNLVTILIVKVDGGYKLIFWEDLNEILK